MLAQRLGIIKRKEQIAIAIVGLDVVNNASADNQPYLLLMNVAQRLCGLMSGRNRCHRVELYGWRQGMQDKPAIISPPLH